jgi:LmbE family N-acetylglucosaminyl deacetylase
MKLLAIGGHAGDMDLTAGAALAQAVLDGHEAVLLHLTPGEKGHPSLTADQYRQQKLAEAEAFASTIGARARFLAYGDGELPVTDEVKWQVADIIRQERPTIVITHWKKSIHKDHANTHLIVEDAIFYAELSAFERPWPAHGVSHVYYADNWEDPFDYQPDVFVEIRDDAYALWLEAASHYAYARGETGFPYLSYYQSLMVVRGLPNGYARAQAFARPRWARRVRLPGFQEAHKEVT